MLLVLFLLLSVVSADLCGNFVAICSFVDKSCDVEASTALDSKCVDSFQLFYQHQAALSRCAEQLTQYPEVNSQVLVFLDRYNTWQKRHACELFHATEAKAASECSGVNAHRPWKQQIWPLFCYEAFAMYNSTRHELDELCDRTAHSEAFWEGYVDYIASTTCKKYYDLIRQAREENCGEIESDECVEMFQWYKEQQTVVETDCLELKASKPFYRGFYKWKKHQK